MEIAAFLLVALLTLVQAFVDDDDEVVFTNTWAVNLRANPPVDADLLAEKFGFLNCGRIFPDKDIYEFRHPQVDARSKDAHGVSRKYL